MRRVLHVLTQPDDVQPLELIRAQRNNADYQVAVVDLTQPEPDYPALLEAIFTADSITVW